MRTILGRFVNNATQTVAANTNVLFTNNTINGCALGYNGLGGIQIKKPGTYMIYANLLGVATGTNPVTVSMLENGTVVPGSSTGDTPAASGNLMPFSIIGITTVKRTCGNNSFATITFQPNEATSFSDTVVIIEKVD